MGVRQGIKKMCDVTSRVCRTQRSIPNASRETSLPWNMVRLFCASAVRQQHKRMEIIERREEARATIVFYAWLFFASCDSEHMKRPNPAPSTFGCVNKDIWREMVRIASTENDSGWAKRSFKLKQMTPKSASAQPNELRRIVTLSRRSDIRDCSDYSHHSMDARISLRAFLRNSSSPRCDYASATACGEKMEWLSAYSRKRKTRMWWIFTTSICSRVGICIFCGASFTLIFISA